MVQSLCMFRNKKWNVILSKDGLEFDQARFSSLQEALRWAEQLRFEDHFVVTVYEPGKKEIFMQYIYDRDAKNIDYTQNLFCRF